MSEVVGVWTLVYFATEFDPALFPFAALVACT